MNSTDDRDQWETITIGGITLPRAVPPDTSSPRGPGGRMRQADPVYAMAPEPGTTQRLTHAEYMQARSASDQVAYLIRSGWPLMRVWVAAGVLLPDVRR